MVKNLLIFFEEFDERANDYTFLDNCKMLMYITNSNFWNNYYVVDLKIKKRIKIGNFEPIGSRLFGIFGCTAFEDYLITTGSSYAIKEQDYAHIRVSRVKKDFSLDVLAIKLCDLGNM
jgi:hypothetical protein